MLRWVAGLVVIIAIAISAASKSDPKSPSFFQGPLPGDYRLTLNHDGRARTYTVHIPPGYNVSAHAPLLIALHGGGGNGPGFQDYSDIDQFADDAGFIVIYPNGTGTLSFVLTWNTGHCCGYALERNVDDVGFLDALIESLEVRLSIDPKRIYVTGQSNGAMMSYRLGAELSEKIAAIAPVAGTIGGQATFDAPLYVIPEPSEPVSVIAIHGLLDESVNYEGGHGTRTTGTRIDLSVEESIRFWVEQNGCNSVPQETRSESGNIVTQSYQGCLAGTEVVLVTILNGGHGWPGSNQGDKPSQEISAAEVMMDFLKKQSK